MELYPPNSPKNVRLLITGSEGFIGGEAFRHFTTLDWDLRTLDRVPSAMSEDHWVVDLSSEGVPEGLFIGVDMILHLAAQISVPASFENPEYNQDVNIRGTQHLIDGALKHGVRRFIHASSAAVYGNSVDLPLVETSAGSIMSPYAASKWRNEEQLSEARAFGLEAISLRFFNVYGPTQRAQGGYAAVIPAFLQSFTTGQAPVVYGDGRQTRDFIHVFDVIRAIEAALTVDWLRMTHHEINVASGTPHTLNDLIAAFREGFDSMGVETLDPVHGPPRKGDILHSVASIDRMKKLLDIQPRIELKDGIRDLIRYNMEELD